jgi:sugar lactone lactonase YvrE
MLTVPTRGGITAGVALRREDLYVAVRSPQPAAAGIWRVSHAAFAKAVRVAALPAASFANGLAFDAHGNLYAADSALGRIWRLAPRSRHASVWSAGPALAPTGEQFMGFPLPGANGLKVRRNLVYVSNTSRRTILTVPVRANGSAGRPRVRYTGLEPDDFAFGPGGDLVVAENPPSRLVRVAPNGHVTTLATAADGLDNPSAVAFGPRNRIYVTNAAYFGTRPSLGFLSARSGLGS